MSSKRWSICSAPGSQRGLMICANCNKKILEGEYLYRETDEKFITLHKACSSNQPIWKARELAQQAYSWAGVNP